MADNQDPLAALQKLLDDQKNAAASGGTASGNANANDQPVEEVKTGPSAEEIAALQKQREEEDRLKIQEQLARMQSELKDTPQYQARLSQKEANDAETLKKQLEERSQRIFQLKHL